MDYIHNPTLFENLNSRIINNIITVTTNAGINLWAASNTTVMHNTLLNTQQLAQAAILINSYYRGDAPGQPTVSCSNITIIGNILTKSATARMGPLVQIRADGLSTNAHSYLNMAYNVYTNYGSKAGQQFHWNVGVMMEDERTDSIFLGNETGWKNHCLNTLKQKFCDIQSIEGNPMLSSSFIPLACSPAIGRIAVSSLPLFITPVTDDFHGRVVSNTLQDAGAVSTTGTGVLKTIPPITSQFSMYPPYS